MSWGSISGVGLSAKGGKGGNQQEFNIVNEAEGPGGGGGGGYIAVTGSPSITMNLAGGVNGTTNAGGLTEFLPNGATMAGVGSSTTNITYQIPPPYSVLPLDFLSFDLQSTGENKVLVNWTVTNEKYITKYDLEQSTDNSAWTIAASKLSSQESISTKLYSIQIDKPNQTTYFRLRTVDNNGSSQYSAVKIFKSTANSFSIRNNAQSLQVTSIDKDVKVRLINNSGQEVKFRSSGASTTLTIDKSSLVSGVYYLVIISKDQQKAYRFVY